MEKILHVVIVRDLQRAALVMPLEQLMSDERKTPEDVLHQGGGVAMGTAELPVLCVLRMDELPVAGADRSINEPSRRHIASNAGSR